MEFITVEKLIKLLEEVENKDLPVMVSDGSFGWDMGELVVSEDFVEIS
jgi:hypothetical protein